MKAFILGTAGHVDHGKTTLIRALTGTDTDRWREEKERGLTIDIGFARLDLGPDYEVGVVDVPGHRGFLKNMLTGSTGFDFLLLVVAADEGPMPQTREHLAIARLLGIQHGVVALSKADRVTEEWRALAAEATAQELCRALGDPDWAIVPVSATEGVGLEDLVGEIRRRAGRIRPREERDVFRMPVDRSFTVRGAGTVVTGTVWSGEVAEGDTIRILPAGREARVRSIQVHGEKRPRTGAGRRCALALVGTSPAEVERGSVVASGGGWAPGSRFGVRLEMLPGSGRGLEHGQRIRVFHGTGEAMARVLFSGRDELAPGEVDWAVLETESPLVTRARDRFVVRFYSPVVTIGGGEIAEIEPPARWAERTAAWRVCLEGDAGVALGATVRLAGGYGMADERMPIATGLAEPALAAALDEAGAGVRRIERRWYSRETVENARRAVLAAVCEAHAETPRASYASLESVRAALAPRFATSLLRRVIEELSTEGEVEIEGPGVRLPGHRVRLAPTERESLDAVRRAILEGGLEAPWVGEIGEELSLERGFLNDALRLLVESGEIVAVTPEYYLSVEALEGVRAHVEEIFSDRAVATPADFRLRLGLSRKYLIPILEYLDRIGLTRRGREGRMLAERDPQST